MFTGIVQALARIDRVQDLPGLRKLRLAFPPGFCQDLAIGASVATDGVCLTVTALHGQDQAEFDIMQQTLVVTTLGSYAVGAQVNVERAAKEGAEIGGHPLSGHVDFVAKIAQIQQTENNTVLRFSVPDHAMRYLFAKGYIAVNGASLTIAQIHRQECWFEVWLIPETLRQTVFSAKKIGDAVNIEIERQTQVIVDTVNLILDDKLEAMVAAVLQQKGVMS